MATAPTSRELPAGDRYLDRMIGREASRGDLCLVRLIAATPRVRLIGRGRAVSPSRIS